MQYCINEERFFFDKSKSKFTTNFIINVCLKLRIQFDPEFNLPPEMHSRQLMPDVIYWY